MKYNGFSIDTEADGFVFEAKNLWVINLEDLDSDNKLQIHPYRDPKAKQKFLDWVNQYDKPNISFHNGLGYDIFVLMFILGIEYSVGPDTIEGIEVNFVDTFYLSMYLNPDRERHGIEYFGDKFNMPKLDFRQNLIDVGALSPDAPEGEEFRNFHPLMDSYCERDTYIGKLTFIDLVREWTSVYKTWDCNTWPKHFKAGQKAFYLMSCQELTGWKFDVQAGQKLQTRIEGMMEEIRAIVEPQLPPRSLKKTEEANFKMPAKPFKKSGEYSSHWTKFVDKHQGIDKGDGTWEFYGKIYTPESSRVLDVTMPMEMANQDQMKDWFLSIGWQPTLFNFKRDANGKPERDPTTRKLILTTPKLQEQGKLCPNLEKLEGELVKNVVKWLSLRNRLSVLTGWLENPRLQYDGRIGAGRTGIAATHRQKHKVVVNVPKADPKVLLGYEFRELWIAEDDCLIAAGDAAALEGRVQGHYCVPMSTKALTRRGWKTFYELEDGEDILAYNPDTKKKEWTPLLEKCKFSNVETFSIYNSQFRVRATANHRWFVSKRDTSSGEYYDAVVETKDLTTNCSILANAPMSDFTGCSQGIFDGKYGVNWVERMISKGLNGVESFLEGFLIADGNYNNQNAYKGDNTREIGKGRWRFAQNLGEHFEAALTSAYISHDGYLNVSYRNTPKNRMAVVTLNKRKSITMQRAKIERWGVEDVWCPRTKFGSWVMRQGDIITITGNTYKYDNGTTAEELLKGDVHSKNCMAFYGSIYEEVASLYNSPEFDKENPKWKPYRNKSKNGYYCLPMQTKVLTATGWKLFDEISVGEKLPTFNAEKNVVEMDSILELHYLEDAEVFEFKNKYDSFQCTDNHRWYGWRRSKSKKGSKNVYGYFEAKDFTQEHNLILTSPFVGAEGCNITPIEAEFMGYLLSDGSFKWSERSERTSASNGKRKAVAMQLCQSRNKFWKEIQHLIDSLGFGYHVHESEVENGNHILHWKISQPDARKFLDRVVGNRLDKHEVNWVEWVLKLDRPCLEAFYKGFYNGDGCVTTCAEVISQNTGKIHEAVVATMQLMGKGRVTLNGHSGWKDNICQGIRMQKRKHLTMQEQTKKSLGVQDTFCLTTGNGSFIIWQDDFIGITGNCIMYGGGGPKVASTLGIPESKGQAALEAFWEANPGTAALKKNLESYWEKTGQKKYLPAIDGRILLTRKKSALLNTIFQSCGGIAMDYACCFLDSWLGGLQWDSLRRPYYLYKGCVVRRIGYFHDEVEFECQQEVAEEVAGLIEKAITKAGEFLKIKVPLEGEGKVGKNWKEVH